MSTLSAPPNSISRDSGDSDSDSDSEYEDEIWDTAPTPSQKLRRASSEASLDGLDHADRPKGTVGDRSVFILTTMPSTSNLNSAPRSSSLNLFGVDTDEDDEEGRKPQGFKWENVEECYEDAKRRLPHIWNP